MGKTSLPVTIPEGPVRDWGWGPTPHAQGSETFHSLEPGQEAELSMVLTEGPGGWLWALGCPFLVTLIVHPLLDSPQGNHSGKTPRK